MRVCLLWRKGFRRADQAGPSSATPPFSHFYFPRRRQHIQRTKSTTKKKIKKTEALELFQQQRVE
jgi:hypothetical protein